MAQNTSQPYSFLGSLKNMVSPFKNLLQTTNQSVPTSPIFTPPKNAVSPFSIAPRNKINPFSIAPSGSDSASMMTPLSANTKFQTPTVPQVTTPTLPITPSGAVPNAASAQTFTTPSGATIDASGRLITPPTAPTAPTTPSISPDLPQSGAQTPIAPQISSEAKNALKLATDAYQKSIQISPDELSTQADIDKLVESTKKAYEGISGQAIPLEFITGQLASVERRATNLAEPLERKLARLQSTRQASLESSKFALDRAEKAVTSERESKKPISGTSFYDPTTGKFIQATKEETSNVSTDITSVEASGLNLSPIAQNIIDLINKGADMDTLIKGTSKESQALRNEVYRGLSAQGGRPNTVVDLFKEGKEIVDDMLETEAYKALGGWSTRLGGQFGTDYGDAMAKAQQLSAILAKDNLGLLKGAMSDKDLEFIKAMSTGFEGAGIQSEKYLQDRLKAIQSKLSKKIGESTTSSTSEIITAPDGTQVQIID